MSQKLPNMLENTIQKIREMVDVNSVIGQPISTPDGVTIIPVSKVSAGFGGGGSDFAKNEAFGIVASCAFICPAFKSFMSP